MCSVGSIFYTYLYSSLYSLLLLLLPKLEETLLSSFIVLLYRLLLSLSLQLVASPSSEIREALMKKGTKFGQDHKGGSPSLDNYFELLSQVTGTLERSVVIVDALDECAEVDS